MGRVVKSKANVEQNQETLLGKKLAAIEKAYQEKYLIDENLKSQIADMKNKVQLKEKENADLEKNQSNLISQLELEKKKNEEYHESMLQDIQTHEKEIEALKIQETEDAKSHDEMMKQMREEFEKWNGSKGAIGT